MPTHPEATRLNLEYYRKQAKSLLKAVKSGEREASQRFTQAGGSIAEPALHDAQLVIAREQGFASWPRFRAFIIQSALDFQGLVGKFVETALSELRHAETMLASHPELAGAGLYAALVLGDVERVEAALRESPGLARAKGGPQNWEPLLYVCYSRFASAASDRAPGLVRTAQVLLRAGADPNASYNPEQWPDNPLSCLYGATGLNNNPALGLALLEAGANPNDGESLYHSTEHPDLACVRLLLKHGASAKGTNALKHMLDHEHPEGLRLLLAAGADPNEVNECGETALHWAVPRGRSATIITALLDAGAAIDAARTDGRTAYALAVHSGQMKAATLLEARGANRELSPLDRFIAACTDAGPLELNGLLEEAGKIAATPGSERLIPELTMHHRTAAVRALLAVGLPVGARGEHGATALHWACWKGYGDLVKILLDHGASLTVEDHQFHGTPPGWFGHGARNCCDEGGDYAEVARLLIAAGAKIPAADMPTGRAEVDSVLREHGLIGPQMLATP